MNNNIKHMNNVINIDNYINKYNNNYNMITKLYSCNG